MKKTDAGTGDRTLHVRHRTKLILWLYLFSFYPHLIFSFLFIQIKRFYFLAIKNTITKAAIAESASKAGVLGVGVGIAVGVAVGVGVIMGGDACG